MYSTLWEFSEAFGTEKTQMGPLDLARERLSLLSSKWINLMCPNKGVTMAEVHAVFPKPFVGKNECPALLWVSYRPRKWEKKKKKDWQSLSACESSYKMAISAVIFFLWPHTWMYWVHYTWTSTVAFLSAQPSSQTKNTGGAGLGVYFVIHQILTFYCHCDGIKTKSMQSFSKKKSVCIKLVDVARTDIRQARFLWVLSNKFHTNFGEKNSLFKFKLIMLIN